MRFFQHHVYRGYELSVSSLYITPLKTNMSPENQWLEDVFPTEIVPF